MIVVAGGGYLQALWSVILQWRLLRNILLHLALNVHFLVAIGRCDPLSGLRGA